jgi:hypothetical protein
MGHQPFYPCKFLLGAFCRRLAYSLVVADNIRLLDHYPSYAFSSLLKELTIRAICVAWHSRLSAIQETANVFTVSLFRIPLS